MDENIILKNIDMIYCYSIGDKNAESIEKLFQITNKINSKIIIQDQTSFNFKRGDRHHKFRNITYCLNKESVIPSHYGNGDYIDYLKKLLIHLIKK